MITDDTGTPGPGAWEVHIAATMQRAASTSTGDLPLLDINYGVGEQIQLKYEVPGWQRVTRQVNAGRGLETRYSG